MVKNIVRVFMILILLTVLLLASNQHGKTCSCKMNFWIVLAGVVLNAGILCAGGFFW